MSDPKPLSNLVLLPGRAADHAATSTRPTQPTFTHSFRSPEWQEYRDALAKWSVTPEGAAELEREEQARQDAHREQTAKDNRERVRRQRESNIVNATDLRITDFVHDAIVDGTLKDTPALVTTLAWFLNDNSKPWLVLSGSTGAGKSVAAAWAVSKNGGLWVRAEKLARIFFANFGEQYEEQDRLRDANFLVLDDIGSERDAGRMTSVLLEILDARKDRRHRTILTTNLTQELFVARYESEPLLSRMHEQADYFGDTSADLRRPA